MTANNEADKVIAKLFQNSQYGRFGMHPILYKTVIENINNIGKLKLENDIISMIELSDDIIIAQLLSHENTENTENTENNGVRGANVNVAIAAAITSYSRIEINKYKKIKGIKCLYSDTDSVILDRPLPDELIGKELGQMKQENEIDYGIFLGPKMYGYKIKNSDKEIVKIKGVMKNVKPSIAQLKELLYNGNNLMINQTYWKRDIINSTVLVAPNSKYKISISSNKRESIYDENDKLIFTKPK